MGWILSSLQLRVGDRDWFAVTLEAGVTYRIDLKGASTSSGTLGDPYLRGVHDAEGDLTDGTANNNGGDGFNSLLRFTPVSDGIYYVSAAGYYTLYGNALLGTYTLLVTDASE